jgi:hypothetical protein
MLSLCGGFNSGWDPKSGNYANLGFIAQFILDAWAPVDVLFADREILYCDPDNLIGCQEIKNQMN